MRAPADSALKRAFAGDLELARDRPPRASWAGSWLSTLGHLAAAGSTQLIHPEPGAELPSYLAGLRTQMRHATTHGTGAILSLNVPLDLPQAGAALHLKHLHLKHLYVAITRAKNNLVMFDRGAGVRTGFVVPFEAARLSPFYFWLRALGLASHVRRGLRGMGSAGAAGGDEGGWLMRGSLNNTPAEWRKRGDNLAGMQMFKLAGQCYAQAGDAARARACAAIHDLYQLSSAAASDAPDGAPGGGRRARAPAAAGAAERERRRGVLLAAADALLTCAVGGGAVGDDAAASAKPPADPQPGWGPLPPTPGDLSLWLRLAAKAFAAAGSHSEAGRVLLALGQQEAARRQFARAGAAGRGAIAAAYEAAAVRELAGAGAGPGRVGGGFLAAGQLLREAWLLRFDDGPEGRARCCRMLAEHGDGLRMRLPPAKVDEVVHEMLRLQAAGDRAGMLEGARSLSDARLRHGLLLQLGAWREVAAATKDPAEAARLRQVLVQGLERFYGAKPLSNPAGAPAEVRAEAAGQLVEALACVAARPRDALAARGGAHAATLELARPAAAAEAIATHVLAHASATVAAVARAAVAGLQRQSGPRCSLAAPPPVFMPDVQAAAEVIKSEQGRIAAALQPLQPAWPRLAAGALQRRLDAPTAAGAQLPARDPNVAPCLLQQRMEALGVQRAG
ncbi:hypothetical protein Rsub_11550 [Raphidocelis subcapitata]|uniref:Uncharacterized protein n=1 Tax=Raphidocelis subcapitata TaxID=307507 RepID=A0A2V0PGG1_9CHLO|nr:hypothetical protein Rsub_11550 [Raphidocelis subcapitata]|eukprot:GBF98911.1 hypothetical protein Rsub_11550 [Raphidocelis subcapitata]